MLTILALLGVLALGLILGLLWRGAVLIGDRRALDRLSSRLVAEHRMEDATRATLSAMQQSALRRQRQTRGGRP